MLCTFVLKQHGFSKIVFGLSLYRTNKKEMEYEQIFLDSRKHFGYNTIVKLGLEE
jgi:hypothetical protein